MAKTVVVADNLIGQQMGGNKKSIYQLVAGTSSGDEIGPGSLPLTAAQSGSIFLIPNLSVANKITLPPAETGLHFKFIVHAATVGAVLTMTLDIALAERMQGLINENSGVVKLKPSGATLQLTAACDVGAMVDIYSVANAAGATVWYVTCLADANLSFT